MNRREFIVGGVLGAAVAGCRSRGPDARGGEAELDFLGTSHGAMRPSRICTCTLLRYGGRNYLIGAAGRVRGAVGKILFHHYGDGWEAGQPGRDERFAEFRRQLGIPAEIVTDLDVRHV